MRGFKARRELDVYHLILAPTHACNLRCRHCYLPDHKTELLSKDVVFRVVDEWSDIVLRERGRFRGIFHVKGGEPLVVPYFSELLQHVVEKQTLWFMITTNGTLGDEQLYDQLARANQALAGHVTVVVSVDGATASTHELLRGSGQFAPTIEFIRELRSRDVQVYMNSVIHRDNLHEIPKFIAMAKALDIAQVNFLPLVPKGYGGALRSTQADHFDIHRALEIEYQKGDAETRRLMAGGLPDIHAQEKTGMLQTCSECVAAYRGLFYIKPDGTAYTCPNLEEPKFAVSNVYRESLLHASDRLTLLFKNLERARVNDRYVCTGEREKYASLADVANLASLARLQVGIARDISPQQEAPETAFCVSRNW